jgi:hypothetical protein
LALFTLLTVLVALGLHVKVPAPVWDSRSDGHDAEVVVALGLVGAALLVALAVRNRRAPADQLLAARLRTALRYLIGAGGAALAVTLVLLVVNIRLPRLRPKRTGGAFPGLRPVTHLPAPKAGAAGSSFPLSEVLYGLAAAILVAAIVAVTLWAVRHAPRPVAPEPEPPAQEYDRALQEALMSGQRALLELDDARAAIIACYLAMEESLARAGTAPSRAETPDELLARAAKTLLVSAGAAARLTSLFYEARFSSHALDDARKDAAEGALAVLAAELGPPRGALAGAAP